MLLLARQGVRSRRGLILILLILFSRYLSIQNFCHVLFLFYSKLFVSFPSSCWYIYSCPLHQPVSRISFCYFGMSCFLCIIWRSLGTFSVFLLSQIYFVFFLSLTFRDLSNDFFWRYFLLIEFPNFFTFYGSFVCCLSFFVYFCPSRLISQPDFEFLFGFLWGIQFY